MATTKTKTGGKSATKEGYAINHCALTAQIRERADKGDGFNAQEATLERADQIVRDLQSGSPSTSHELPGIELMAQSIARHVLEQGAGMIATDLDVNLARLKSLAASEHISSC